MDTEDIALEHRGFQRWMVNARAAREDLERSNGYRYALWHDRPEPGASLAERIEFFRNRAAIRITRMARGHLPLPRQELDDEGRLVFDPGLHLYLVEFVGVCVKVGITDNPIQRIAAHRAHARKMSGRDVGRIWVTRRHLEARDNELILKAGARTEYLEQDFDSLIQQADQLDMTFEDDDE